MGAVNPEFSSPGTLYGVGLGPGDPDLMTIKAGRVVADTLVVAVPVKAEGAASFARAIVADRLTPEHRVLELVFPMRSDPDYLRPYWERAAAALSAHLDQGRDVAFLCEGDPFTFGTFIHVFRELVRARPGQPVEVIPGVTAYNAAAARTLTPLAAADDRVAVVPATYGVEVVDAILDRFDSVVLLKVKPVMDALIDLFERRKLLDHAVFVNKVGTAEESVIRDLTSLRGQRLDYLSLVLVQNPHRTKEPVIRGCRAKAGTPDAGA